MVYTSGTTGVPKGAMITQANLVYAAKAANQVLYTEPHFCTLLFLPMTNCPIQFLGVLQAIEYRFR